MISSGFEYDALLYNLQNETSNRLLLPGDVLPIVPPIPSDEPLMNIDLNTRTIDAPPNGFLSVQYDHKAEILFLCVDRFYEHMDLGETTAIIQYVNAAGESRTYHVPWYDGITLASSNKLLIPWNIGGDATKKSGNVQYSIRFYTMEKQAVGDDYEYVYTFNISTIPQTGKVLHGLELKGEEEIEPEPGYQTIIDFLEDKLKRTYNIYWIEV